MIEMDEKEVKTKTYRISLSIVGAVDVIGETPEGAAALLSKIIKLGGIWIGGPKPIQAVQASLSVMGEVQKEPKPPAEPVKDANGDVPLNVQSIQVEQTALYPNSKKRH